MKLIRYQNTPLYNPISSYTSLRDEMDRLFDVAFPALSSLQQESFFGDWQNEFPIDLYQEKDAFIARAELPGFRKEDISVEVADGILTITGHEKSETKTDKKESAATTRERQVTRSISLPEYLKLDNIGAVYQNGVLTVTLPKSEEVKPRQIAVEVK
ncbi:MAG: Hsp20/alpha crystallin family protein [Methylacidiphilales bacterium]|nr:Hsp20/alpha crystallin family protein [Candidatus Methylacidiphilales bacterium]